MKASVRRQLASRKRRILRRIKNQPGVERHQPMMTASNIHYEIAEKVRAIAPGGIGAMHLLARKLGLVNGIDQGLHLLKRHLPYFESDHVLNIAYNLLAGGSRLEHLEVRRNDEVYLDALGAQRIPDPTTAGDFCRRFTEGDVEQLMSIFNEARLRAWKEQPEDFFAEAFIDADGALAPSDAWCKQGVDIAYDGSWGYHPLVVSLANTSEPLYLVNRSGNRPSHEHADVYLDQAAALCRRAGFRKVTYRGDTKFTQTRHLDRWDTGGIRFIFGMDARANLKGLAERLDDLQYSELERSPRHTIKTASRQARERHKERIVAERQFDTLKLVGEEVAEFPYKPVACEKTYRVVVLRKKLVVEKGQLWLFEPDRYFFYLTNDLTAPAPEVVFLANDRCDQENLIARLKGGVPALKAAVDDLVSNWASMVMASLAWTLKAWAALLLPEEPGHVEEHRAERRRWLRMEFATFRAAVIELPCQVVRGRGRLIFRLMSWNPWQGALLRLVERLRVCWLC
ncbi:MAG: IS1380 family transposase [Planctomycetaceae bacterium]|nr:IS1380 family transposase [Planctomycetaceae bacterium]